jgi:hypothetical protein
VVVPLQYTQPAPSHAVGYLDQYLKLYSRCYGTQRIGNILDIEPMARAGRIDRILYIDRLEIPFYFRQGPRKIIFDESASRDVFHGKQITLKEMRLHDAERDENGR